MWPNPQFPADLVTFTEVILNGKLHFLCCNFRLKAPSQMFDRVWIHCWNFLFQFFPWIQAVITPRQTWRSFYFIILTIENACTLAQEKINAYESKILKLRRNLKPTQNLIPFHSDYNGKSSFTPNLKMDFTKHCKSFYRSLF